MLQTTTREIIANSTYEILSENHSKQYLQTITTEMIQNNTYKLFPGKSLQTVLTKVYQRTQHIIHAILIKLLSENSLQAMFSSLA